MANPRPTPKPGPGSKVTGVIPSEIQPEQFGVGSVFVENRTDTNYRDTNYREEAHHHLGDVLANRIIRLLEFPGQLIELLLATRAILPSRVEGRDDLLDVLVSVRGSGCSLRACVRVSGLLAGDNRTHLG